MSQNLFSRHPLYLSDFVGVCDVRFTLQVPSEKERVDDRTSVIQLVE